MNDGTVTCNLIVLRTRRAKANTGQWHALRERGTMLGAVRGNGGAGVAASRGGRRNRGCVVSRV